MTQKAMSTHATQRGGPGRQAIADARRFRPLCHLGYQISGSDDKGFRATDPASGEKIRRLTFAGGIGPGVFMADLAHNLTLIQAYAALGVALLFKLSMPLDSKVPLGKLIEKCDKAKLVTWKNFALIDDGQKRRSDVAHRATWLSRAEVFEYAEAIQDELIAMGILDESELYKFYQRR